MQHHNNPTLFQRVKTKFQDYTSLEIEKVLLCVQSLCREHNEIESLISSLPHRPFAETLDSIFYNNLKALNSRNENKSCLGCYFCFSATCNQLTHIGEGFSEVSEYSFIALVDLEHLTEKKIKRYKDFSQFNYLALPSVLFHRHLSCLNAVFLPESNTQCQWHFPRHVIRIGCPHGLDIPLIDTIERYGGNLLYDYILSSTPKGHRYSTPASLNIPDVLRDNSNDKLCAIPLGFPKLDTFVKRVEEVHATKLVYHLSNWQLESKEVRDNVGKMLEALLRRFPNVKLVLRPFPEDLEQKSLKEQIHSLTASDRFSISQTSSYIDDYVGASLLITHRQQTGQMYTYATGRPIFCLDYAADDEVSETPFGILISNIDSLCEQIEHYLSAPNLMRKRLEQLHANVTFNTGSSMQYLIKSMPTILKNEKHPDWLYLDLYHPDKSKENQYQQTLTCLTYLYRQPKAFNQVSEAAISAFPIDPSVLFFAAESQSRTPDPLQHTYYFFCHYKALEYMNQAQKNLTSGNDKLNVAIINWMSHKGQYLAQNLLWQYQNDTLDFHHNIDSLFSEISQNNSQLPPFSARKISPIEKQLAFQSTFNFDMLATDRKLKSVKEVALYCAGQVAACFIHLNQKYNRFNIVAIYDSDPNKHNEVLLGHKIQDKSNLKKIDCPIVICSFAFEKEISLMLHKFAADNLHEIFLSDYVDPF